MLTLQYCVCVVIASVIIEYAAEILILGIKLSRIDAIIMIASDLKIFWHNNLNASPAPIICDLREVNISIHFPGQPFAIGHRNKL